jgi:hypothetical protein
MCPQMEIYSEMEINKKKTDKLALAKLRGKDKNIWHSFQCRK